MQSRAVRSPSGEKRVQCRAVEGQTICKDALEAALAWLREKDCSRLAWSEHPAEGDKPAHYHFCARWESTVDVLALRKLVNDLDKHSHVDKVGRWPSMVRYLRHLDNPEKAQIPPDAAHYEGFPETELEAATAAASDQLALVTMIAEMPHGTNPVEALRIALRAGFRPSEVSGVTRALYDLRNLLLDGGAVGIRRNADSAPSGSPSARRADPSVVFVPDPSDPAFFALPDECYDCPRLDE